jgi:hypothetical protein
MVQTGLKGHLIAGQGGIGHKKRKQWQKRRKQLFLNVLSQKTEWLTRRFSKFEKMVRMLAWM